MCKIFSDDVDKLLMKKNHMRYMMSLDRHLEKRRSYLHTSSDKKFSTMSLIDMTQFKITKERIVFFHLCHIQFFSSLILFGKICPLLLLSESRHKIPFKFMLRYFWHDDKWQLVAIFFLYIPMLKSLCVVFLQRLSSFQWKILKINMIRCFSYSVIYIMTLENLCIWRWSYIHVITIICIRQNQVLFCNHCFY